jgi:DNA polymerase I
MKILSRVHEIRSNPDFYQGDTPVALTAPFIAHGRVLIGLYGSTLGYACIHVSLTQFEALKAFLYEPQTFRIAVHGIERVWRTLNLGKPDTNTHLVLDTELMAHLLNSGGDKEDYALSHLVHEYLQEDYRLWMQEIGDRPFPQVMHGILAWDAYLIYQTAYVLNEQMHAADPDLAFMYTYGEVPLVTILLEMSRNGIGVDSRKAAVALAEQQARSDALHDEITGDLAANLWRKDEVYELWVGHHGTPWPLRRNFTYDDLKRWGPDYPFLAKIVEWHDLQTDLDFLEAAAKSPRVHPEWNIRTKTSRIYARNPAVQNVSKETCRPLLIPSHGCTFLKADYKQLQMRLLANMSQDPELIKAFAEGKDVHWLTVEMCGIQGATDRERRDIAKEVNYGILFQMTARGLAKKLDTDVSTAQRYINAFWSRYAVAKEWLDNSVAHLKKKPVTKPYIESYLGRRRRFAGKITSGDIRRAKATVLQQSEAEVLRMALMNLIGSFRQKKMKSRVVMILHDAIWVEAPMEEAEKAKRLLIESMRGAVEYPSVTLDVELECTDCAIEGESA